VSTVDQTKNKAQEAKGNVKEAAEKATNNPLSGIKGQR
jgi:uncharacterized protein YjbJ (UPF0337 family)